MTEQAAGKRPRVACAGILVADIFVPPLSHLPPAGALLATEDFLLETGGCAANTGTVLAALGVDVAVSGVVGDDVFADFIRQKLASRSLDVSAIRADEGGTSKTVVLTVAGEDRRFLHTFGANTRFRAEDLDRPVLADASVLYLGGYMVLPGLDADATAGALSRAQDRGATVVLDVVVPAGSSPSLDALAPVLPYVDVFMPNDEEATALTGLGDPQAQADAFMGMGCRSAVITQGGRGTLVSEDSRTWRAGVYPVDFVDGSGSGDAFAAGYIVGLLEGWETQRRLEFASAVGALACTRLGCTAGVSGRERVEELIAWHTLDIRHSEATI